MKGEWRRRLRKVMDFSTWFMDFSTAQHYAISIFVRREKGKNRKGRKHVGEIGFRSIK
jgi:hypothetical protein